MPPDGSSLVCRPFFTASILAKKVEMQVFENELRFVSTFWFTEQLVNYTCV